MTDETDIHTTTTIRTNAADRKAGMTLDELGAVVQAAMRSGLPGNTPVRVGIGWSQQIQRIVIGDDRA